MLKVVSKNYIKADKLEEFLPLAKELVKNTKQNDAGCIRYELLQDVKNPLQLTMLEEWEDQEALKKHGQSKHFKEAVTAMADFLEKPADTSLYIPID